jgi:hypothetical protein
VRGTIVSHLTELEADAAPSVGEIKVVHKAAVLGLWRRVADLLSLYGEVWSGESIEARSPAAERIAARIAPTGWFDRALIRPPTFVEDTTLLAEWT